jgi:hypothetical protein
VADANVASARTAARLAEDEVEALEAGLDRRRGNIPWWKEPDDLPEPDPGLLAALADARARLGEARRAVADAVAQAAAARQRLTAATAALTAAAQAAANADQATNAVIAQLAELDPLAREAERLAREAQQRLEELTARLHDQTAEAVAANNVADGLALQRRWRDGTARGVWDATTIPFGEAGLPALDGEQGRAVADALRLLDDAVDAVGDTLLAESVHQAAQRNPLRAGASPDALSRGELPPPELDMARTPRSGNAVTHRILALFGPPAGDPPGWDPPPGAGPAPRARAAAEPRLNAWAGRLLGDPARVRCRAAYLDPAGAELGTMVDVSLRDLALAPLDVVYGSVGQQTELELRLADYLLRPVVRPAGLPVGARVRLDLSRATGWPAEVVAVGEFLEVARAVRELLTGARAADGSDLALPEDAADPGVDLEDLRRRADDAAAALRGAGERLEDALAGGTAEALREAMRSLADLGALGAVPAAAAGDDPQLLAALRDQAAAVERAARQRRDRLDAIEAAFATAHQVGTPAWEELRDHQLERLHAALGDDVALVPRFTAANAAELRRTVDASTALQGGDGSQAVTWFERITRVRAGAARLADSRLYAEALGGDPHGFRVGQLPSRPGDRWAALPTGPDGRPGGRLSLVLYGPDGLDLAADLGGLVIDEWTEVVPSRTEVTAVSFRFDAPGARAPQAVLLAVPPDERGAWELETLEAVVLETLQLLKLRLVDLDALAEAGSPVGQFLPALYFAGNVEGDTVTTDLLGADGPG